MPIYLSRWNLLGTMISMIIGAYLVTKFHLKQLKVTNRMMTILKFYWFICNNSVVFACVISTIYWTMLYREGQSNLNNYLVHVTNSFFLVTDLLVVRHPHRMSHFIYPMASGGLYMSFTVIYTLLGGVDRNGNNFVYPVLDWKSHPQKATVVGVGCVIFLGIIHILLCGVHRARNRIYQCLRTSRTKPNELILL